MENYIKIWNECLNVIKDRIPQKSFETWFLPIVPIDFKNEVLKIQVPSQFFYEWLEENYVHVLQEAINKNIGENGKLEYSITIDKNSKNENNPIINAGGGGNIFNKDRVNGFDIYKNPKYIKDIANDANLNPNYVFENFIEGDCNRLARSAAKAIAEKPGETPYNPLVIYGESGLGKTHLIQAAGNEIKKNFPDKYVFYIASEKFISQFVNAIQTNNLQEFTALYRNVDVLIIDDIQFLRNKEKTQEIFFHIFNHLHQNNKQIILSSDRSPKDIQGVEDRLLSRFKWGLTTDLQLPDFETRLAIIKRKIHNDGISFPDDVIEYLAYSVDTNIRELEGVIISVIARTSIEKSEITMELVKKVIKELVTEIDSVVQIDYIQKVISEYFGVTEIQLKSKSRKKEIVIPRQIAMYLSKSYTNYSLKLIGQHFGGRDHSTVIHALESINNMIETDANFRLKLEQIKKKIKLKDT